MTAPVALTLKRPNAPKALISLVAMIDVLLILLVFFMVTSTYLDLDLIPAVAQEEQAERPAAPASEAATLLVRLGSNGAPVVRGKELTLDSLDEMLRARLAQTPALSIVVLPSGAARMQSLISIMDTATTAGVTQLRVIRLEARE